MKELNIRFVKIKDCDVSIPKPFTSFNIQIREKNFFGKIKWVYIKRTDGTLYTTPFSGTKKECYNQLFEFLNVQSLDLTIHAQIEKINYTCK